MRLDVLTIDFHSQRLAIAVDGSVSAEHHERLRRYVSFCEELGFVELTLVHLPDLSSTPRRLLDGIERMDSMTVVLLSSSEFCTRPQPPSTCVQQRGPATIENARGELEYHARFTDLRTALDQVTKVILLMGEALVLDDQTLSLLRLCLYELTVNTVEHATFLESDPLIEITLVITDTTIAVTYIDNAAHFHAAGREHVDIEQKIREGSKRGFGLYILNKITVDLKCDRWAE